MQADDLTDDVLRRLREPRSYPAVSLTLPTHRREPDNAQDPVRLRNVLAEAGSKVDGDPQISRQDRIDLLANLERAADEADLRHARDGLVVFATPSEYQLWSLPREVPERVVLSDTFLTRNLVAARAQARPYWVLALAADRATLWSGVEQELEQHRDDGFPAAPEPVQWDVQREERTGGKPSTFMDEETRQFLRTVDASLAAVLEADPRPLYVVGLAQAVSLLAELGPASRNPAATVLKGGLQDGPAAALLEAVAPAAKEVREERRRRIEQALDEARGRKTFAAGLDEIWEAVRAGRVDMLAVEEHFQQTVKVTDGHLAPVNGEAASPTAWEQGVRTDIVDEVVETALDGGAEVVFLPDDRLADHGRIAAVLRF
ncbi:chemotaxis protein [Kitasatospora sp. NPDC048365]|uniref:baeRF3 domain-containing protein n=1 Tax=Kitasatospora sp. NPDC048365 TaxID=3364050 RepID=UPI0037208089